MTEWRLYDGDVAYVSTFDFHEHRERAPHWDQPTHRPRLERALEFCRLAFEKADKSHALFVDLGCGDGGLVAALQRHGVSAMGYDFQPSNAEGWNERGVANVNVYMDFVGMWKTVWHADIYVMTEVLEHLTDPHGMLGNVRARDAQLVCSSPATEHAGSHDECHAWAWDEEGYAKMITDAGFTVVRHDRVGMFQVVWAVPA